ncbi:MAG: hypothetical protein ACSW8I_05420 [bacterium]
MKKILLITILLIATIAAVAQDRIVMKDGTVILGSVKAITEQDLHYCPVVTDASGNYFVDDNTVHVLLLAKVESATHSSGRQLYPQMQPKLKSVEPISTNPYIFPRYKNPAAAFLLSTIPGCGQFYNDQIDKGAGFVIAALVESSIFMLSANKLTIMEAVRENGVEVEREVTNELAVVGAVMSGLAFLVTYIWSTVDAVTTANKLNIANGYVIKASPTLSMNSIPLTGGNTFTAGLSLSLSF